MAMKIFLLFFVMFSGRCFSQSKSGSDTLYKPSVLVSALLHSGLINQAHLDTGFYIKPIDTSYRIVSFCITYPARLENNFALQQISCQGAKAVVDRKYPKLWNVTGSGFVSIDRVLLEKNGQYYYGKSFIVNIEK